MAAPSLLPSMGLLNQMPPQVTNDQHNRRIVKKVSWAPENNLCQVRLFLAEEAPLQAGQIGLQDQLQAKKPWLWHAIESGIDDDLPPGFESTLTSFRQQEVSIVPQTPWRCPPRFVINHSWQVAAGDESKEIKLQCEREVRILEAVYPRPSSIPPCPAEPSEAWEVYDDSVTPLIPLIPIEEEEEAEDLDNAKTLFGSHQSMQHLGSLGDKSSGASHSVENDSGSSLNSTGMPSYCDNSATARVEQNRHTTTSQYNTTIEPDVAAAAAAAFVAIMRSNEEGSMIDQDLLIKILSNPQIIETLISQHIKNNNTKMECSPTSLPVNNKPNGNEFTHKFENDASFPSNYKPQVAPYVNLGTNKNRVSNGEMPSSQAQSSPSLPISEARAFITPEPVPRPSEGLEITNARNNKMSMASSAPLPSTSGHGSSQMVSRPAMLPVTSTNAVCNIPNVVPATTQTIIAGPNWTSSQNEQYYKNLIQQHGGPNKNDHIHQNGLHYRKELIQQHGGQQNFERGTQLQPGNMGGHSCVIDMNKAKFRKNCLYFNSPKGCRRGSTCLYLHDHADRPRIDESDMQQTKRAKIEIEISGKH